MSETLARNLDAWPSHSPRPTSDQGSDRVRVASGEPWPALLVRDRGHHWVAVHSRRDPIRDAERALAGLDVANSSTLFVIGLGLGFAIDVLERDGWTGRVVALEPSPAMVGACLRRRDWATWLVSGRLSIVYAPDYQGLDAIVPTLDPNREAPTVLVNPVIARCFPDETDAALRTGARAWFGARANQEARRRMGGRYLLNTLRNVRAIAASADVGRLTDRFSNVPAILVAAGPSLDRNLPDIAAWRDRAMVVAVDTAARPLLGAGVVPDLVVAVDPSESNARHLVDLPDCTGTALVTEGSVDPAALQTFAGRQFVFRVGDHHPWPWLMEQGIVRGRLRAWGSVLTTAFDLVLRAGCNPILFAGADLAFTDARPYARGTTYEEDWRREQAWGTSTAESWRVRLAEWPEINEPGVTGTPVRTAPHLVAFRDWLAAESLKAAGRTVVNASGQGILIGTALRQSSIAAVLEELPSLGHFVGDALAGELLGRQDSTIRVDVSPEVLADWRAFGRVTDEVIAAALTTPPDVAVDRVNGPPRMSITPAPAQETACERPRCRRADLSESDAEYLDALAQTHHVRELPFRAATEDLVAAVRAAATSLAPSSALVVIDHVGTAVGAQVRRAVNALLCERTDIWLDYRRFTDRSSRLSVLRADGATVARDIMTVDAPKWLPDHMTVADSLVPLIAAATGARSVVDLGCGAGYWLRAFESLGATRLLGLTPHLTGHPVHPAVRTVAATELLAGLPSMGTDPEARFELCLALEVAHELPIRAHGPFVAACARLADVVVFSFRPPGAPGMSPFARPLPYWTDLFWTEGFVLEDRLRGTIEERWNFPRTVFDGPLVFRRALTAAERSDAVRRARERAMSVRLQELYEQSIWWAVRTFELQHALASAPSPPPALAAATRWWTIPAWRLLGEDGDLRRFSFRTDAARHVLTDPRCQIDLQEEGRPLPRLADLAALRATMTGGWTLDRDVLWLRSRDGSDPRANGRQYAISLPGFVAWAESQPLQSCLSLGL
ncbi:MAG: motility associated factor glycosyltransferase family protein [Vicinamibacterales bacterium]